MAPTATPVAPAEVVEIKDGIAAFEKEREEARRALQMQREAENEYQNRPMGRCCLNRALAGEARWCHKDKWQALVSMHGSV